MSKNKTSSVCTILLILCTFCWPNKILSAANGDVQITLTKNESLRQISERLFGDKNAWRILLHCNGIENSDAVSAGTSLRVPIALYNKLHQVLAQTALLISEANSEGAALLADKEITEAIHLRDQALRLLQKGQLEEAVQQATLAEAKARTALAKAKDTQTRSVEAWLATKVGTVQNRPPDTLHWQDTALDQKFVERERVRTLADSHCTIKFSDQSQIMLDEHALVAIGSMEKNVLRSSYNNTVSMIEGDIAVHLASLNQNKQFTINLPDITTDVRSRSFVASRDKKNVTRIANYDGEIDVKARGSQVTVKKNQGTKILPGAKPSMPKELLPPPPVLTPKAEQKFYASLLGIRWKAIPAAQGYHLEISRSANFNELLVSERMAGQSFEWQVPSSGVYFFRIQTIDQDGCLGTYSEPIQFVVDLDNQPPFLVLHYPEKDLVIADQEIEVHGEVEKTALLRINGQEVHADAAGQFRHKLSLAGKSLVITAEAVDKAGNFSTVERTVRLKQESKLVQLTSPERIISKTEEVVLSGQLVAGAHLLINKKPVQAAGAFTYLLHLTEGEHTVEVEALSAAGKSETLQIQVLVDQHPPQIEISNNIEHTTSAKQIVLRGTLSEKARLSLNGKQVTLLNKRNFKEAVPLLEGKNELLLTAEDLAGNQSIWQTSILRDSTPPKILSTKLSPAITKGGEVVQITVQVEDTGVGVAKSGSFVIQVNGQLFKGMLRNTGKDFVGSIFILPGVAGAVKVREIQAQDMLGNTVTSSGG